MKRILWLASLSLACGAATGEEATGGLADAALTSSDLGGQWTRRVEYLFDSKANPPEIFQVATNISRWSSSSGGDIEKSIAKQKEDRRGFAITNLARLGAEAQIILEYHDSEMNHRFSMFIYRFKTAAGLDDMWKRRRESAEFSVKRIAAEEVIYTKVGQAFPGRVKASRPSVEEKEGRYHIMVSPGKPEQDDPGLGLVRKQVEKLRNNFGVAPSGAPTTSPAKSRVTNGPPSVN